MPPNKRRRDSGGESGVGGGVYDSNQTKPNVDLLLHFLFGGNDNKRTGARYMRMWR